MNSVCCCLITRVKKFGLFCCVFGGGGGVALMRRDDPITISSCGFTACIAQMTIYHNTDKTTTEDQSLCSVTTRKVRYIYIAIACSESNSRRKRKGRKSSSLLPFFHCRYVYTAYLGTHSNSQRNKKFSSLLYNTRSTTLLPYSSYYCLNKKYP